ncbi:hypothetical protein O1611_g3872 [Lasiodiplodia mahajangana]|uniref:Uncharacterized protein n=1 Tax=Lasiodiplodia mahajangana TaxID=1108764 RepID=A0ACC2JRD7_9PEZI|nr:hypothetical protein O1611_g3872 [Lasiodiplodia mahajangana]
MAAVLSPNRPNAEDLWEKAVADLSDQDKAALNLDRTAKLDAIAQSLELASNAADTCKKKAWRFRRRNGQEVIARDVFAKVVRWISHFQAVGDTAVQYDPAHAALPWAGVRFVLQVCVDYFETHDFLLEKISQVAEQICRLQILESLKHVSARFDTAFQVITTAKADMEWCFQMANTREQCVSLTALKDDLARLEKPMARWSDELTRIADGLDRSRRIEILKWISSEPYLQYHKRERETFLEGTGNWLISHPVFQQWKDESASSLLWLHGIPGSGKSKLASLVIEDALEAFRKQKAPSPAYFYCSRDPAEPERSKPANVLASIVRQFSSPGPGKPLLRPTIMAYQSQEDDGFPIDSLQLRDSYNLLLEILDSYPTATIIIDALDECDPLTRQKLLDTLENILRQSPTLVKIFVSSRDDQDIKYNLRDYPALEVSSDLNSEDISRFVKRETELLVKQGRLLQSSIRKYELTQKIMLEVASGAHGMFRWASLQLAALCDLVTDGAILERLGRLPPTLGELYQEILSKIRQYKAEADRTYAENTLAWLLCSRRSLKTSQFLTAISTADRPAKPLTTDQVLRLCCNLVVFDSTVDGFRFAHLSVREFLEAQPAYQASTMNSIAARCCLTTLMDYDGAAQTSYLYAYASCFWAPHCEDADSERESGPLHTLLEEFLSNTTPGSPFSAWNRYEIGYLGDWRLYSKLADSRKHGPCGLAVASLFNFVGIVKSQTQQRTDFKTLHECAKLSASHGMIRTLEVFLNSNEFTVTEDIIIAAAGNESNGPETIALLLESCGHVEITQGIITAAARNYHDGKKIMALLLEKCSPVKITEGIVQTIASSLYNSTDIMALLVKKCDRIELTDAIVKAIVGRSYNSTKMMALLLENCNPVNITEGIVEAAAHNLSIGKAALALLVDKCNHVEITESIVGAVVRNGSAGKAVLSLLLDKCNNVDITEGIVEAAVGNQFGGNLSADAVIELLLKKCNRVKITGRMVDAAAVNWPIGKDVLALLLNKCSKATITEGTAKAVENIWSTGNGVSILRPDIRARSRGLISTRAEKEKLALLLEKRGSQITALLVNRYGRKIKIIEAVVKAAVDNENSETVALLLKEIDGQMTSTDNVVKTAADDGKRQMMALFSKMEDGQITNLVEIAASHSDIELMALLLEKGGDQIEITESVWKAAENNANKKMIDLLLEKRGEQVANLVKVAANNWKSILTTLLLDEHHQAGVTEAAVEYAASGCNWELLQKFGQDALIQEVLKAAAGNPNDEIMTLLLRKAKHVAIPEEVVQAAAGNLNSRVMATVLHMVDRVAITEEVIKIAARNTNSIVIALLLQKIDQAVIQERVKDSTVNRGSEAMAQLLRKANQAAVTEEVVKVAASNWNSEVMALLLKSGGQTNITEDMVRIAAGNPNSRLLARLLEHDSRVKITEEVIKAAAGNWNRRVMAVLLEKRSGQIKITRDIVKAAAGRWESGVMALLLEEESEQFRSTEETWERRRWSAPSEYL